MVQYVLLGLAGLMVLLSAKDSILPTVTSWFNQPTDSPVPLVKAWEELRNACKKHGCKEALTKVNAIFPLLLKSEIEKE